MRQSLVGLFTVVFMGPGKPRRLGRWPLLADTASRVLASHATPREPS